MILRSANMLKVFLVEDEAVVRRSIKKNIPWEEEGFTLAGEASDGELAYPQIRKIKPDILITDIRMPFMDGLELSRLVKKEMPDIKIIILSGFDEFDYAKQAISIGVTDYLLKPADAKKMVETLRTVAGIIEKENAQKEKIRRLREENALSMADAREKFFQSIIKGGKPFSEFYEEGRRYDMDFGGGIYVIELFTVYPEEKTASAEACESMKEKISGLAGDMKQVYLFKRGLEGFALLFADEDEEGLKEKIKDFNARAESLLKEDSSLSWFAGVGRPVLHFSEMSHSFEDADKMFCYRFMAENNHVLYFSDRDNLKIREKNEALDLGSIDLQKLNQNALNDFLRNGTLSEVRPFTHEFFRELGKKGMDSMLVRHYLIVDWNLALSSFIREIGGNPETILGKGNTFTDRLLSARTTDEIKKYLREYLDRALELRNMASQNKYAKIMSDAKEYIAGHYNDENISLNSAAEAVSVSPSYFSTLFSQEEGKTFIEYLTDIRMQHAKELLRCSSMKASEVGFEVGYKDNHYFASIFKKTQGMTPTEYRAKGRET